LRVIARVYGERKMKAPWKPLIILSVTAVLLVGGLYFYLISRKRGSQIPTRQPANVIREEGPGKGEVGYEEASTTVAIGTKEVSIGDFNKVEDGNIFYEENGTSTELPLTIDEVVLACTNQNLAGASELDYGQITSIYTMTPAELGGRIPQGEQIVVFTSDVDGILRAHTVAISASSCND
jgi:hypothetical protein